jgi:hypothetical protein
MKRLIGRLLMGLAGAFSFACYTGVAYLAYRLLRFVVLDRPAVLAIIPLLLGGAWLLAYLNYRSGPAASRRRCPPSSRRPGGPRQ